MKYSDVNLGGGAEGGVQPEFEEWAVDKHTQESPTDAYGIVNFQGGSHSYRAKVGWREAYTLKRTHTLTSSWWTSQRQTLSKRLTLQIKPVSQSHCVSGHHHIFGYLVGLIWLANQLQRYTL